MVAFGSGRGQGGPMDCKICDEYVTDSFINDEICDDCCLLVARKSAFTNALEGDGTTALIWASVVQALKA